MGHDAHGRDIGPTSSEFIMTCYERQPAKLGIFLLTASVCFLFTLAITLRHRCELVQEPICLRRIYYIRIAYTPSVLSGMALLTLLSPSSMELGHFVQKLYESMTLSTFGMLLFILLWHESSASNVAAGNMEEDSKVEAVAHALARQGPRKHWGSPPCCCLRPCLSVHNLSVRQLSTIFWMVRQYVVLTPVIGILGLLIVSAVEARIFREALKIMKYIIVASNIICLWGLFISYKASHDLLIRWKTTRKFMSIKLVLVIMVYQEFLLEHVLPHFLKDRAASCFQHVEFQRDWVDVEIGWYTMWLLTVEMVFMALALRYAFPAEEVRKPIREIHHAFLDMEMSRKILSDGERKLEGGAPGSESEDEEDSGSDEA